MNYSDFSVLFYRVIEQAVQQAEAQFSIQLPKSRMVEFHGFGLSGDKISLAAALEKVYLGDDLFFVLIDVVVIAYSDNAAYIFMRISGHPPVDKFEKTYNSAIGLGAFKFLEVFQLMQYK